MKDSFFKTVILLAFIIISSQMVLAEVKEVRESCIKYDKSRTMEEFKQVILTWKDSFIQRELWRAYANRANDILKTSKLERVRALRVTPDLAGMSWLMAHSYKHEKSHFKQSDYINGVRINDRLVPMEVEGQESDWVTLEYEDIIGMYAKIACCNPEEPKSSISPVGYTHSGTSAPQIPQNINLNVDVRFKPDTIIVVHKFEELHIVFDNAPVVALPPANPEPFKFEPPVEKRFKLSRTDKIVLGFLGGIALGYAGYKFYNLLNNKNISTTGSPGGAPPIVGDTTDEGGPGGATKVNFVFSIPIGR